MKPPLVLRALTSLKARYGLRTYHFELGFALVFLSSVAALSGKGAVEWIGVFAVFFTFAHATVADRLAEIQAKEFRETKQATIECYYKLERYFYLKEALWFVYFLLLGAWSAIAGVFLFLLYPVWRKWVRASYPL
jgi:hypothetical protein